MQVAKIIPSKLIRKVIKGKLADRTDRNFMVECISKQLRYLQILSERKYFKNA